MVGAGKEGRARAIAGAPHPHPRRLVPSLQLKESYTACLRAHAADADACVVAARAYLACRMDAGLMEKADLDALGVEASGAPRAAHGDARPTKARTGFVAGVRAEGGG